MSSRPLRLLAFDLGASGGRAVLGALDRGRLRLAELHRFANGPIRRKGHLYWDTDRLFGEVLRALKLCARRGTRLNGIGVDAWGVDFALLDAKGQPLGLPFSYRDPHTGPAFRALLRSAEPGDIYRRTGIQFLPINTLYQLAALAGSHDLESARSLLFIPDYFSFRLCGRAATERTVASTSQLLDLRGRWSGPMLALAGVPRSLLPPLVPTGSTLGPLLPSLQKSTGLGPVPVIATAGHDTASAIAAVPAEGTDWAYISCGTWSLVGVETLRPCTSAAALRANFTNEAGVGHRFRLLKNVTGLWLVQRLLLSYPGASAADAVRAARSAPPWRSLIDPDWPCFANPLDMRAAIRSFCRRTGQPVPHGLGPLARCVIESLALRHAATIAELAALTGRPIGRVHLVGGGVRNALLCQLTADATGLSVLAGPAEATAVGNTLVQAMALGAVDSLDSVRAVVRRSFPVRAYRPGPPPPRGRS
ncbi:MAG: rhamnulokinase family protein [bacterium]